MKTFQEIMLKTWKYCFDQILVNYSELDSFYSGHIHIIYLRVKDSLFFVISVVEFLFLAQ